MKLEESVVKELKLLESISEFDYKVITKTYNLSFTIFKNLGKYDHRECELKALENTCDLLTDYRLGE